MSEQTLLSDAASHQLGAGNHFSVFLDKATNTLYSSGENVVNQLGNGATGFDVKAPQPVVMPEGFDETIVSVATGLLHSTFLTESGNVYAFGFNNRGPLGQGDEEPRTEAVRIEALDDTFITQVESGNGYSLAIDDQGALFGWGFNSNGQLGLGDRDERLLPVEIDAFNGESINTVSAGNSHTLVLTESGKVFAMGSNTDGQLGSSQAFDEDGSPARRFETPVEVEGLPDNVVAVNADTKTSFAVTADGKVFGWGESRNGQLLNGEDRDDGTFIPDESDVLVAQELSGLPDDVVQVSAGARWAVARTEDGDVWAWGPNDEGPTGGLDGDPEVESEASFYPVKMAALDDVNVVELQTGPNSILAITDAGEIYAWGSNSDGRLGFSSDGTVYTPTQVSLEGDMLPWLVSASPEDNARDVEADTPITLTFTEPMKAGEGNISLINRDSGDMIQIDVNDQRQVVFDGKQVVLEVMAPLAADARYHVSIDEGALLDMDGNTFAGIADDDTSTFNFSTSENTPVEQIGRASCRERV